MTYKVFNSIDEARLFLRDDSDAVDLIMKSAQGECSAFKVPENIPDTIMAAKILEDKRVRFYRGPDFLNGEVDTERDASTSQLPRFARAADAASAKYQQAIDKKTNVAVALINRELHTVEYTLLKAMSETQESIARATICIDDDELVECVIKRNDETSFSIARNYKLKELFA